MYVDFLLDMPTPDQVMVAFFSSGSKQADNFFVHSSRDEIVKILKENGWQIRSDGSWVYKLSRFSRKPRIKLYKVKGINEFRSHATCFEVTGIPPY